MIQQLIKPSGILNEFIYYYYIMELDGFADYFPSQRVYPFGSVVLVFHYGQPSIFKKRQGLAEIEPCTTFCGQQTSFYDLSLSGKTGMIFILFKPHSAGKFFKIPVNEITNLNISLELVMGNEATVVENLIQESKTLEERIVHVENFLIRNLIRTNLNSCPIKSSIDLIDRLQGNVLVHKLAEESCLSIKQFERKFLATVGLTPKQYIRIVRFQKTIQLWQSKKHTKLTSLAFESGYYDQPHFINDFKYFTDLSPKEFLKTQIAR